MARKRKAAGVDEGRMPEISVKLRKSAVDHHLRAHDFAAVSQMEVLWLLAVSVGSPEVVSVMRPADLLRRWPLNRAEVPYPRRAPHSICTGAEFAKARVVPASFRV
jgi:hypothetical protein